MGSPLRQGEARANALWGGGSRGGKRASAHQGRGGGRARSAAVTLAVLVALALPVTAGAKGPSLPATYVAPGLLEQIKDSKNSNHELHVIVQSAEGAAAADGEVRGEGGGIRRQLRLVGAVAVDITAAKLERLARHPGLVVTPDAPVQVSGSYSHQMWPYEAGNARLWADDVRRFGADSPTIAIVDSGLEPGRADLGARAYPQVNLATLQPNAAGDGRGHGTFVAGIAAGDAPGYAGAAPNARVLPIDVMDDNGKALTSDVIAACQFILENKARYNIRVANFSLHSSARNNFFADPLDRAVERLWFDGIFVVAAAGNYGSADAPSGVLYAPGNDPFVLTVGAVDLGNSIRPRDDTAAPWSAYGYTEDGFAKPEIGAPGRYMVGPVPATATLASERPDRMHGTGYIELSGTSFAAPVVAGAAAQILARHPLWTPDQVKGALMLTAKPTPLAAPLSTGVGELNAAAAALYDRTPPNGNNALAPYVRADGTGRTSFDAAGWSSVAKADASWASASWASASWASASWSSASWASASWASSAFADASWASNAFADASWASVSLEDAAEGDGAADPYAMTPAAEAELAADPELALPPGSTVPLP